MKLLRICFVNSLWICLLADLAVAQQVVEVVKVISKPVERSLKLPGEFTPYLGVAIHAKVTAFIDKIEVDRGSVVQQGQLLATLLAPEVSAQRAEVEAKAQALEADTAEAEAKVIGVESMYNRLREASETPGAVAGNDVIQANKELLAARALLESRKHSVAAARKAVEAVKELEGYLKVTAAFNGVITERLVHPGALVGPGAGTSSTLFQLEQLSRLRLVVAVPETAVGGIAKGAKVSFHVPAYPGEVFSGVIARIPGAMDSKTRTMPVELDVSNSDGRLAPGMYPEVSWPVQNRRPALLVPPSSVVATMERTFVIRVKDGKAEWVNVTRGSPVETLIQVFGQLKPGDEIVRRGSDEIREGVPLKSGT